MPTEDGLYASDLDHYYYALKASVTTRWSVHSTVLVESNKELLFFSLVNKSFKKYIQGLFRGFGNDGSQISICFIHVRDIHGQQRHYLSIFFPNTPLSKCLNFDAGKKKEMGLTLLHFMLKTHRKLLIIKSSALAMEILERAC